VVGGGGLMGLEERVAKVEARIAEEDALDRWEKKALRIAKTALFIIAVSAPVVWALFEFISFLIDRFVSLGHSLGW
jgi:hypothetical protein